MIVVTLDLVDYVESCYDCTTQRLVLSATLKTVSPFGKFVDFLQLASAVACPEGTKMMQCSESSKMGPSKVPK